MNPEEFYAVVEDNIIELELQRELPEEFLRAIPRQLDTILDVPTMAIGGWDNTSDGPLVLAIDANGQMVSIVAVNPTQLDSIGETLASIDYWLSSMNLRNLSELSGNNVEFYEGLLDLRPGSSIVLAPRRRYVLVTGIDHLDVAPLKARLPDIDVDVRYLDVLRAPGGPEVIRQRSSSSREPATSVVVTEQGAPVSTELTPPVVETIPDFAEIPRVTVGPAPAIPDEIAPLEPVDTHIDVIEADMADPIATSQWQGTELADDSDIGNVTDDDRVAVTIDETASEEFSVAPEASDDVEAIDLTAAGTSIIDLDELHTPALEGGFEQPPIEQGHTYDLELLPLLFDATGATLESISDELFAVNDAIVIVVSLPERRRDTPFEDRRRFRWDTTLERIQLLNEYSFTANGARRIVHLFVESERQPDYAAYVGELNRTAFQTRTQIEGETAWFSISPSLSSDLYKLFRKGRLPHHHNRTVDIHTL